MTLTIPNAFELLYQKQGHASQRLYPNEELLRFMGQHFFVLPVSRRKKIRILEVGCGSGANLWMLAREGFQTYGIDSSKTGLELCIRHLKTKWNARAKIQKGDFTHLPFKTGFFNAVIDVVSLQHTDLAQKQCAFEEVYRVLTPKGRFFSYHLGNQSDIFRPSIDEPVDAATVKNITDTSLPLSNSGLVSFLSPDEAIQMLTQAGFSKISIESVQKTYRQRTLRVEYLAISCQK